MTDNCFVCGGPKPLSPGYDDCASCALEHQREENTMNDIKTAQSAAATFRAFLDELEGVESEALRAGLTHAAFLTLGRKRIHDKGMTRVEDEAVQAFERVVQKRGQ